ncbi:hypothetical protein [Halobacillus sp. Nhm2S1]|uniref:hypothetical protein n=1 Tax=Halobacillus sp. Nhm2S1 TaxID=2866716 RepID=UPI001C72CBB2|nr:hypothetical protein [Halobacillus sp. Nhm2S1]MBX0356122.1 hypothetical protein [Halobacillus sp. Nhm2S1]
MGCSFLRPVFDIRPAGAGNQYIHVWDFFIVVLVLGLSYQLKVDQMIEYRVCFFNLKESEQRLQPADIHKIVFKDAGWGRPAGSVIKKKGFPLRVVKFDSVKALADLESFAERYHIKIVEKKYYRTVYERKKSKEKKRAS